MEHLTIKIHKSGINTHVSQFRRFIRIRLEDLHANFKLAGISKCALFVIANIIILGWNIMVAQTKSSHVGIISTVNRFVRTTISQFVAPALTTKTFQSIN